MFIIRSCPNKRNTVHVFIKIILGSILILFLSLSVYAHGDIELREPSADSFDKTAVQFGERPPIDLDKVPDDAIEEGIIYVKFNIEATKNLQAAKIILSEQGTAKTGIETLDLLNRQYGMKEYLPLFRGLYHGKRVALQQEKQHEAWGLHQWYEIKVNPQENIREVLKAFAVLKEVESVTPVFKKILISNIEAEKVDKDDDYTLSPAEISSFWVPDDPQFSDQWHYHNTGQHGGTPGADIDLLKAWDLEKGFEGVIVAIIDTGIQYDHPDLEANMWPAIGYNFVEGSALISPGNHGTHVAGTVAAVSDNGAGVAGIAGGSGSGDGVRLMSCQVFTADSNGGFHLAPVWAADNGAAITQNSWGYAAPGVYEQPVLDAIDYFNAHGGGTVLNGGLTFFAAGNNGDDDSYYPAFYSGAIAVAATNNLDQRAWYSNFGTWIDISAPGGETGQIRARGVLSTVTGSSYEYIQGTSMASPHAAGVAALIISAAPGQFSAQEVRSIIKETADNHYAVNPGFDKLLGAGRINAYQALLVALHDVRNPTGFKAVITQYDQIDLSWNLNSDEDDVLVLWASDGIFGRPADGVAYSVGDDIYGGGSVLYIGDDNNFSHTGLPGNTAYYYRAFSSNPAVEYSTGVSTNATTYANSLTIFPWVETFEDNSATRDYWRQIQESGAKVWSFTTGAQGGNIEAAYQGHKNARFTSTRGGGATKLVSPLLDLSAVNEPHLLFWYGQEDWLGDQNELKVYYRTNLSANWVLFFRDHRNRASWTPKNLSLPNPSAYYQIAFEGLDNWGHANVIDNVTVYSASVIPHRVELKEPLNSSSVNQTPLNYQWFPAACASKYQLQIRLASDNTLFRNRILANVSEFKIEGYLYNNTYKWRVRAGNDAGWGQWSPYRTFTYLGPPARVLLRSPANRSTINNSKINFRWNPVTGAGKYQLQVRRTSDNRVFRNLILGNRTGRLVGRFLGNGTEYKWRVRAGNDAGWGRWSAFSTFINVGFNVNFNRLNGYQGWVRRPGTPGLWNLSESALFSQGQPSQWHSIRYRNAVFDDFDFSARVRRLNSLRAAQYLIVRAGRNYTAQGMWSPGYAFGYANTGRYSIWKLNNYGTASPIQGWTSAKAINRNGWNALRVQAVGSHFNFYINDTLVNRVEDRAYRRGTVGIMFYRQPFDYYFGVPFEPAESRFEVSRARLTDIVPLNLADVIISSEQAIINREAMNNQVIPSFEGD